MRMRYGCRVSPYSIQRQSPCCAGIRSIFSMREQTPHGKSDGQSLAAGWNGCEAVWLPELGPVARGLSDFRGRGLMLRPTPKEEEQPSRHRIVQRIIA